MNLVNELQVSAECEDVLTVLRKAKRLASKLGVDDINHWLKCERDGYSPGDTLPKYRVVKGHIVYDTNGFLPAGFGMVMDGTFNYPGGIILDHRLPHKMGELVALIMQSQERGYEFTVALRDEEICHALRNGMPPFHADQVTFRLKLNIGQIRAIPEAVKDKILDWALELEQRGVLGKDMSFNEREKELAHGITTFNIYDCDIRQLSNTGKNINNNDD